ncbi:MAG: ABC transporter substrate-binding protein, partial [Alphaproteobacteria bacterium]|nr:ABC transporter substrate-binding protein [Alphaproteobacteria bacterium]
MLNVSGTLLRTFPLALMLSIAVFPALAAPPAVAPNATEAAAAATPQGKFIQDLGDKALSILADKNNAADQRNAKFRQMMRDSFDLTTIGRFVLGRNWLAATPEQQKEYMHLFEELVVKTYSD